MIPHRNPVVKAIIEAMERNICQNPPEPFVLAGKLIKELDVKEKDFFIAVGQLLDVRLSEIKDGKKRYYYLSEMVVLERESIKKRGI